MGDGNTLAILALVFSLVALTSMAQLGSIKQRLRKLELSQSSPANVAETANLVELAKGFVGQLVQIRFKDEDATDGDTVLGGLGTGSATCTLVDVDAEWVLVCITTRKTSKEKLLRLNSIASINAKRE